MLKLNALFFCTLVVAAHTQIDIDESNIISIRSVSSSNLHVPTLSEIENSTNDGSSSENHDSRNHYPTLTSKELTKDGQNSSQLITNVHNDIIDPLVQITFIDKNDHFQSFQNHRSYGSDDKGPSLPANCVTEKGKIPSSFKNCCSQLPVADTEKSQEISCTSEENEKKSHEILGLGNLDTPMSVQPTNESNSTLHTPRKENRHFSRENQSFGTPTTVCSDSEFPENDDNSNITRFPITFGPNLKFSNHPPPFLNLIVRKPSFIDRDHSCELTENDFMKCLHESRQDFTSCQMDGNGLHLIHYLAYHGHLPLLRELVEVYKIPHHLECSKKQQPLYYARLGEKALAHRNYMKPTIRYLEKKLYPDQPKDNGMGIISTAIVGNQKHDSNQTSYRKFFDYKNKMSLTANEEKKVLNIVRRMIEEDEIDFYRPILKQFLLPIHAIALIKSHDVSNELRWIIRNRNPNVSLDSRLKCTALHLACIFNADSIDTISILANTQSIDAQDINGETPLHIAERANNKMVVLILKEFGADEEILNNEKQKPSDLRPKEE